MQNHAKLNTTWRWLPVKSHCLFTLICALTLQVNAQNVGIGIIPTDKLTVAGTIRSTEGGIKFPDGSIQTSSGWTASGNAGTGISNFIGTTDAQNLRFRTNNIQRMVIESGGEVGIGTTSPNRELTVFDTDLDNDTVINVKDGTRELFMGVNSGGASIRTLTNHSLSFWANNVQRMTAESTGDIGIGTTNPEHPLHINKSGVPTFRTIDLVLASAGSKRPTLLFSENSSSISVDDGMSIEYDGFVSGNKLHVNGVGGTPRLTVESFGNVGIGTDDPTALLEVDATTVKKIGGGSWTASSDIRLKQDIYDYRHGLEEILRIRPVNFRYNEKSGYDTTEEHIGVIAQEVQEVAPYMVSTFEKDGEEYLEVDNSAMTYMLINAVQELADQNKQLQDQLLQLRALLKLEEKDLQE